MKQIFFSFIFILTLAFGACTSDKEVTNDTANKEYTREELKEQIEEKESVIAKQVDNNMAMQLINLYDIFAQQFPDDKETPDYLFKAGEISSSQKESQRAISFFNRINNKYPEYPKTPYALFLSGFVYETQLNDTANARKSYEEVIKKFPNERITEDAKASIKNLGKTPEQLIEEFEKKNKGK